MPRRIPRPVIPVLAAGLAASWIMAGSVPAIADQVRQQEWWLSALDVTAAWQSTQGGGVTVAVLSDGVDAQQSDLSGIVTTGPDFTGTGQGSGAFFGGQGTAAASLIAGHGNGPGGGAGIVGVAPKARILSVRVTLPPADTALDSSSVGAGLPSAIAQGIRYAVAHHATVIDLPTDPGRPNPAAIAALPIPRFATRAPQTNGIFAAQGGSTAEQQAVAFALSKGVVLVAPAGDDNEGANAVNFPASYPGVISVGAFDSSFTLAPFSAAQPYVTVTAGGANVTAADTSGGFTTVNSTSAAAAMVAGMAALIRAQNPGLTPAQVRQALTSSTVFKGRSAGSGAGTVDAAHALVAAASLAAPASARAGARAQPLSSPPPPNAAPVSSNSLLPGLLRSAAIAAGLLIVLLAAIAWRAALGRREKVVTAQATKAWAKSTQNLFSAYGPGDSLTEADKMLEYFAAPSSDPSAASASPFAPLSTGPAAGAGAALGAGAAAGTWAAAAPAAARAATRQPRVSGRPPWEPAAEPASDLPWASVPGPAGGVSAGGPAAPAADSAWPSGAGPLTPPPPPAPGSELSWDELAEAAARHAPPQQPQAPEPSAGGSGGFSWGPSPSQPTRSPSGSDWESAGTRDGAGPSASWPDGTSEDAYRPPPGEELWHAAPVAAPWQADDDTGSQWQPTDTGSRWAAGDPWQQQGPPASAAPWEPAPAAPAAGLWEPGPDSADRGQADAGDLFAWRPEHDEN